MQERNKKRKKQTTIPNFSSIKLFGVKILNHLVNTK